MDSLVRDDLTGSFDLAGLVGTWRGDGIVRLPMLAPRPYREEIRFSPIGTTSIHYRQRAVDADDDSLLHTETGVWRIARTGRVELSIALPGATEVSEGRFDGRALEFVSTAIGRTATGPTLAGTARRYWLQGDSIRYEISIATESFALAGHLDGELERVGSA